LLVGGRVSGETSPRIVRGFLVLDGEGAGPATANNPCATNGVKGSVARRDPLPGPVLSWHAKKGRAERHNFTNGSQTPPGSLVDSAAVASRRTLAYR